MQHQFWIGANGAFLDAAVLEWCKVFAEWNGKHHWRRLVTDRQAFKAGLLAALSMSEAEFQKYINTVLAYRDKFVAHLDEERVMHIPRMRVARECAAYLFNHFRGDSKLSKYISDAPSSARTFYASMYRLAHHEYKRAA